MSLASVLKRFICHGRLSVAFLAFFMFSAHLGSVPANAQPIPSPSFSEESPACEPAEWFGKPWGVLTPELELMMMRLDPEFPASREKLFRRAEKIPEKLSAMRAPAPPKSMGCGRLYLFQDELKLVDSDQKQDAERLRKILAREPEALALIETYQRNRREVQMFAYTGTLGLIFFLGSGLVTAPFSGRTKSALSGLVQFSGLALLTQGFIHGLLLLQSNESNLGQAVELHNRSYPNEPIQLQFGTGFF